VARHSAVLRSALTWKWPAEIECPNTRFLRAQHALQKACAAAHTALYDSDFAPRGGGLISFFGACYDEAQLARRACSAGGGRTAVVRASAARDWLRGTKARLGPSLWGQVLLRADSKGI